MIQIVAVVAVLVSVSVLLYMSIARTRHPGGEPVDSARMWVTAHHWAVATIALTGVLAMLVPSDLFGTPDPSDPWGGYVGHWVTSAAVWTVLMLPVTVIARAVVTRASSETARISAAAAAWVLLAGFGGMFLAALT